MGRAAAHARRVGALQKRIDAALEAKATQASSLGEVQGQIAALQEALAKADKYNARVGSEIAKLDAEVASLPLEKKVQLKALFDAYTRSEVLLDYEARFKASCKAHLAELQARLAALQAEMAGGEPARRLAELRGVHAEYAGRLARARGVVAAKTIEVSRLQRLIDEVPSQAELLQYERRFLELYDQVAEKLDETRKYYTTYNMLLRKRDFVSKEESLIDSMLSNFACLKNKSQRQAYLNQVDEFVKLIEDSLRKQRTALDARRSVKDAKAAELQRLVEVQRAYFKAVKEFQEECDRNESLSAAAAAAAR